MARLNDKDWLKIKVQFESTDSDDTSLEAIAKEFGCSKGAISQKAKKDGWIRAKNKQTMPDFDIDEHFASIKENAQDSQDVKALRLILAIKEQEAEKEKYKSIQIERLCKAKPYQLERVDKHLGNNKGVREKTALDTIEQLLGIKLIRQFHVGGFRIDGYDADNKVAYEIDEEQHRGTRHSQHDVLRQQFIEEQLQCKFVRIKV